MMYSSDDPPGLVKVLSLLKSHDNEYLSGQDLSDVLKISRVAVWKYIKRIKELGYGIESRQKLGYRLKSYTDQLLPWEITSGLDAGTIWKKAYYFDTTDSTQTQAAKMAHQGTEGGTIIAAGKQTDGRGRNDRRWVSTAGGIWFSVILRPRFDVSAITMFPMTAALALSDAIKKSTGIQTEAKWPNDLTIKGRKVAGMLVDASLESNRIESMILGVGINFDVNANAVQSALEDTPGFYGAASLAARGKTRPPILVRMFLEELEEIYDQLSSGKTGRIKRRWIRLSSTVGKNVKIRTVNGTVRGKAVGIDDDGALLVSENSRITRIMAGDVTHM